MLIEAGCEDVFLNILDFVRNQGGMVSGKDIDKGAPSNEDEAMEVITQTLEDIVSNESDQLLPMVRNWYIHAWMRIMRSLILEPRA